MGEGREMGQVRIISVFDGLSLAHCAVWDLIFVLAVSF